MPLLRFQYQGERKDKDRRGAGTMHLRPSPRARADNHAVSKASPFRVLCTTTPRQRQWGSYNARCLNFKSWLNSSSCANLVEMSTGEIPPHHEGIQYNATMYVKSIPPEQANLGRVFVDVVDGWGIRGSNTPDSFEVIVQNPMHGTDVFPNHTYHVIEHMYSSYPLDVTRDDPENIPDVVSKNMLQLGIVCSGCAAPTAKSDDIFDGINITFINEAEEGFIDKWFVKYMEGWTEERMNSIIADPKYGFGKLYTEVFRKSDRATFHLELNWSNSSLSTERFDVLIVNPKKWYTKLTYGSGGWIFVLCLFLEHRLTLWLEVQRITSQMRSGTPVLVENEGLAFSHFLDEYNYTCVFSDGNNKHQTFEQAIHRMKDASYRKDCQRQGLRIATDFSPRAVGMKTLRAMGFEGLC